MEADLILEYWIHEGQGRTFYLRHFKAGKTSYQLDMEGGFLVPVLGSVGCELRPGLF